MNPAQNQKLSKEQEGQIVMETAQLKRTLKSLSKNQLIVLLLQQVNLAVEQQNVNKVLLERLKELEPKSEPETKENQGA